MRVVFGVALLGLMQSTLPAAACPRGAACIGTEAHDVAAAIAPVFVRTRMVSLRPPNLRLPATYAGADRLGHSLRTHVVPRRSDAIEMPWIWQVLRHQVYRRMPHYEERRFSVVASPVVVTSTFDTVPGAGLEGEF